MANEQKPERYHSGRVVSQDGDQVTVEYARALRVPYQGREHRVSTMRIPYDVLKIYEKSDRTFSIPARVLAPHIKKHLDELLEEEFGNLLLELDAADDARDEAEIRAQEEAKKKKD